MFPSVDSSAITDVLHMMEKKMLIQDRQILQDDPLPHFFVSVFYFEKSMCNVMFLFSQVQGCAYSAMLSKGQL